jgi:hypothetical protein
MIHNVAGQLAWLGAIVLPLARKTISAERRMVVDAPWTTARPSALYPVSGVHLVACLMYFCCASVLFIDGPACLELQYDLRSHVSKLWGA